MLVSVVACSEIDTERQTPPRGTVGEEMYGVLCDRLAAGALREDMTGESFRNVCHKVDGKFADEVDESKLPVLAPDAVNEKGDPVSVQKQRADRDRSFARIRAFVKRRSDVISALDAALPSMRIAVKDLKNKDETKSCNPPAASGEGSFLDELANMLGRFTDLYNDGTIPESTRSMGKVVNAFHANPDAQAAYARLTSREGYRPASIALGMARPAVAYPRLRDMTNSLLYVIASDYDSFLPGEQRGIGYAQFAKLLEVSHAEMLNATADPLPSPLVVTQDPTFGRQVISRPRDNLEIMQEIMLAQDAAFVGGDPKYIVKRDGRGYAALASKVAAPFVDKNGDGLPDVDDQGRFVSTGSIPTPFAAIGVPTDQTFKRDDFGRVMSGNALVYDYIDTNRTFVSRLMRDMRPLLNPDPDAHQETLMDAMGGMPIMLGPREGGDVTEKRYANGISVKYNAVLHEDAPILDLVYAATQVLGDKSFDDVLQLTKILFTTKQAEFARVVSAIMKARDLSPAHPEAEIPATSTFWDEILDATVKLVKEPGLLEDIMDSLSQDDSALVGNILASWAKNRDQINYNPQNINGPPINLSVGATSDPRTPVDRSQPDSGDNRSILQRFIQLVADGDGVAVCNQDGAQVHARLAGINITLPTPVQNPYKECEIYKIPDVATFFLQTIVGAANLNLRDKTMRTGIIGIGAATTALMEDSSGLTGFWSTGTDLRPKPEWASRLVFFDQVKDSPNSGDLNYRTNHFLADLNGRYNGTNVCPERIIDDPCANGGCNFGGSPAGVNDVAPDGKVRGLRNCSQSDWIQIREKNTIFAFEQLGFYKAMTPLVRAFVNHHREDIFTAMDVAANKHWQSPKGAAANPSECRISGGKPCAKSGLSSYEAIISEFVGGDLFPALQAFMKSIKGINVKHCTAVSAQGLCTASVDVPAFKALADATRALVDPEVANKDGLKDRLGSGVAKRNDGGTNPQVTPVYLLTSALSAIDASYVRAGDEGAARKVLFRTARSRLADQFLGTTGSGTSTAFSNPSIPKVTPVVVDVLRAQMWARCPKSFAPPYERCTWAKDTLPKNAEETLRGPMFASAVDLLDTLRSDGRARRETEAFMQYMLDATSQNDALASMLASAVDMLQVLRDDQNLIPFFKVLAEVVAGPTLNTATGKFEGKGVVDAQLSLLGKISGRYRNGNRVEICSREIDPNELLSVLLTKVMTPMEGGNNAGMTPLEVFIDVVAEVNRAAPGETAKLEPKDYTVISENVADFLLNKERGLEQFYEIVRKGTGH